MSDSVQPHRWQPTRLLCPWDSPGKNTGVGCHFLLQCMKVKSESEDAQSCLTLATPYTAAYQAPPSTGFSSQEYWNGLLFPSPYLAEETPNFEPKWPDIIFYRSVPRNWTLTVLLQCSNILLTQIFKMKVCPVSTVYTLFIYSILDMIIFCLHRLTSSLFECDLYSGICF